MGVQRIHISNYWRGITGYVILDNRASGTQSTQQPIIDDAFIVK